MHWAASDRTSSGQVVSGCALGKAQSRGAGERGEEQSQLLTERATHPLKGSHRQHGQVAKNRGQARGVGRSVRQASTGGKTSLFNSGAGGGKGRRTHSRS